MPIPLRWAIPYIVADTLLVLLLSAYGRSVNFAVGVALALVVVGSWYWLGWTGHGSPSLKRLRREAPRWLALLCGQQPGRLLVPAALLQVGALGVGAGILVQAWSYPADMALGATLWSIGAPVAVVAVAWAAWGLLRSGRTLQG
jgi:hypothetical protein